MKKSVRLLTLLLVIMMVLQCCLVPAFAYSTVRKGSRGADVKTLQTMLNKVDNAALAVDGIFGNGTLKAVKNFQKANGLTVDGIVGPKTWSKLEEKYDKPSTLAIGSGRYSPGELQQGKSYSISGTISSNYNLTKVTVGVYTSGGAATGQIRTVTPGTTSYDIKKLDNYIRFGALPAGSYAFRITATDASGKTVTKQNCFSVKGAAPLVPSTFANTESNVITYSRKSEGEKNLSTNFKAREFACKDGSDTILIDQKLVALLQDIRNHFGKPVIINSAYRNAAYNKKIGGAEKSQHVQGKAADIRINGVSPTEIAKYAETIGVQGIGLYDGFVHVDTRTTKSFWKTDKQIKVNSFQ